MNGESNGKSRMKWLLFFLPAFSAMFAPSVFSQEVLYNGFDEVASMQRKVRDVVEVKRTPLFDNAPFLHLRKGDKLVKAREDFPGKMGIPLADPDRINYYLFSNGKYFQLWTTEEKGKLLLSPAFDAADNCLLFDWDFTMANARSLRQLFPGDYVHSLTIKQYDAIVAAISKEFPDIQVRDQDHPDLREDQVVNIPGHAVVEFQGLAYDATRDCIYKYVLKIGPDTCLITGWILIQGPRYVQREEFEGNHVFVPNGPPVYDIDPKTAEIKKAEYDKMIKFQNLVDEAIHPQDHTK